jgi:hypothetical protein
VNVPTLGAPLRQRPEERTCRKRIGVGVIVWLNTLAYPIKLEYFTVLFIIKALG